MSASRTKDTYLAARYRRIAARRDPVRARYRGPAKVADHRDYDNHLGRREAPRAGW